MTVANRVELIIGVSGLSLVVAFVKRQYKTVAAILGLLLPAFANAKAEGGGEASLVLPDLKTVNFTNFFGLNGHDLLSIGLLFCAAGLLFGLVIYVQLKNLFGIRCLSSWRSRSSASRAATVWRGSAFA